MNVANSPHAARKVPAFAPWLFLLTLAILINYIDRGNLALAAPLLKGELHLSAGQLGILLSAFFWLYTLLQFVMGSVVDRFEAGWVFAAGFFVWSLATIFTGLVNGFLLLLAMRLLLGVGESVTFPAGSKMIACHVPPERIGFANGLIIAGIKAGPAVGAFGAGLLIAKHGWRPIFIGIGVISLFWLPAWKTLMPRGASAIQPATITAAPSPAVLQILRERSFWGASAGHFSANYFLYLMISWLPFYLVHERHLSLSSMAKISSLYYLVDASSALLSGWFSDFLIHRGLSTTLVRKSAMAVGHTVAAAGIAVFALANAHSYLIWLVVTGIGAGMAGSGIYAYCQILAGPRAAGTWTGLQNGFGNFSGVIAPAVTGFLVDQTGNFRSALLLTAAVTAAGALCWTVIVRRLEPIPWPPRS